MSWSGIIHIFLQVTKEEVVQTLRRQSKGFQKTSSQYRGVTRHQKGKWEARIGQMVGKKYKWALLPMTCDARMLWLSCHCTSIQSCCQDSCSCDGDVASSCTASGHKIPRSSCETLPMQQLLLHGQCLT